MTIFKWSVNTLKINIEGKSGSRNIKILLPTYIGTVFSAITHMHYLEKSKFVQICLVFGLKGSK